MIVKIIEDCSAPIKILVMAKSDALFDTFDTFDTLFAGAHYEIFFYSSGEAALTEMAMIKPEVIICELDTHDDDTFEFIKKVKQMPSGNMIPILGITGAHDSQSMIRALQNGASLTATKEALTETVLAQVQNLTKIRELLIRNEQLNATRTLIGVYKHELCNTLAILEGMTRKLSKNIPSMQQDPAMGSLLKSQERFYETIKKLNELRNDKLENEFLFAVKKAS